MKKKTILTTASILALNLAIAQDCSTDPSKYTGHVVSGEFAFYGRSDDAYNDVVALRNEGTIMYVDVLKGSNYHDDRPLEKNVSNFVYDLNKVNGRMVSGDFDNDNFRDDFALIYKAGPSTMKIDVFSSDNASSPTFTKTNFLTLSGYDPDKVTGRVVAGDFDRDGKEDDIAMFYDYGGGETRIHLFESDGSNFSYSGSGGWWSSLGYTASKITDRVVSGDFDQDGKKDDIAVFYDYGGGQTRIHVFESTGSSFSYSGSTGWWSSYGYSASQISGRVVAVDIDRSGKSFDDIAVFYDYGGGQTRMHVFTSNGSSFDYSGGTGWWSSLGYTASKITGKVVALDTRKEAWGTKIGDILAFYDYGPSTVKYHIWKSYNPLFGGPYVTYGHYNFCETKSMATDDDITVTSPVAQFQDQEIEVNSYPNPSKGLFTLSFNNLKEDRVTIEVYSVSGVLVYSDVSQEKTLQLDLSAEPAGIYILNVKTSTANKQIKLIKE